MTSQIIIDDQRVYEFVTSHGVSLVRSAGQQGIGLIKNDELVAGVIYDDYNGSNIWMHVAANPGKQWLNRQFLYAAFAYPFKQLTCNRVTGWVEAKNSDARRFDEHLGFKQEAVLSGAAQGGGDVIIYRMFKDECRFIR